MCLGLVGGGVGDRHLERGLGAGRGQASVGNQHDADHAGFTRRDGDFGQAGFEGEARRLVGEGDTVGRRRRAGVLDVEAVEGGELV